MVKTRFQTMLAGGMVLLGVIVFAAVRYSSTDAVRIAEPPVAGAGSGNLQSAATVADTDALRRRIAALEVALAAMQKELISLHTAPGANPAGVQPSYSAGNDSRVSEAGSSAGLHSGTGSEQAQQLQRQRMQQIEDAFYSETADSGWAIATEQSLLQSYQGNSEETMELLDNSCRNSACRLELAYGNESDLEELLLQLDRQQTMDYEAHDLVGEDGRRRSVIYLVRHDYAHDGRSAAAIISQ